MNPPRLAMLVVFAALIGCGLSEYEEKMGYAKSRIDYMEKLNDVLGNPLTWPENIVVPKGQRPPMITPPRDAFLRPPKGINPQGQFKPFGPLVFRFAADKDSGFEEMYFGATTMPLEKLKKEAATLFAIPNTVKWQLKEVNRGPGRNPVPYDSTFFEDQRRSKVYVYVVLQDQYSIIVVYKMPPGASAAKAMSGMDYSLGTLATGFAASQQRDAFPVGQ